MVKGKPRYVDMYEYFKRYVIWNSSEYDEYSSEYECYNIKYG